MTNWPGATAKPSSSGSSVSVHVSTVSCRFAATRNDSGTNAPAGSVSVAIAVAIHVEESEVRPLQALHEHLRETPDDVEAEDGIRLALVAEARAVELRRTHGRERPGVEVGAIRREEPRPAEHLPCLDRLDHDLAARRHEVADGDRAVPDDVEGVRGIALAQDRLALVEVDVAAAARDQRDSVVGHPGEEGNLRQDLVKLLGHWSPPFRSARRPRP